MSAKPIKVLYFASVRTLLGVASEEIRPPPPPSEPLALSSLAGIIASRHQDKAVEFERLLKTCKWSVEQEMVEDEEEMSKVTLKGGEEVAIIPPVRLEPKDPRAQGHLRPQRAEDQTSTVT
ncbi:hypothetical protein IE53DRAFT_79290 [Violaceomyces palustris]|uniref:Uncharacterized protein n=1 Tax=Violaceomyces palustris TaxID=1673888 RepID=A0ACD0NYE6_9BASI|nr:hypothetical protein IE53DRAFT_79290 [Violaceomyces palustris]